MSDPDASSSEDHLRRHVRILADLGRVATQNLGLKRFLDQAAVHVARGVGIDHTKILRYRPETADLLLEAGHGWKDGAVGTATFPVDFASPPGRTLLTAEATIILDFENSSEFVASELLREHGIQSLVNVAILVDGAGWGVLEVDSTRRREFASDTLGFLDAVAAMIGVVVQRHAAETNERAARNEAAASSQSRQLLLLEMQHRVKNNLQLILASVALQKRRLKGEDVTRALDHISNRVQAISLAHDQLAPKQDLRSVNLAGYLRALCAAIEQQCENVAIAVDADEVELAIERAVPLGLIVNEAITNSVKHAFNKRRGRAFVRLTSGVGYGEAKLEISDNGRGMSAEADRGSGLPLMESLARQIGGEFRRDSSDGVKITVLFAVVP